jgi:hypothetical protein
MSEPHNIHFTTEKENRKSSSRKRKTPVPSEWKIKSNYYEIQDTHTETLKELQILLNKC